MCSQQSESSDSTNNETHATLPYRNNKVASVGLASKEPKYALFIEMIDLWYRLLLISGDPVTWDDIIIWKSGSRRRCKRATVPWLSTGRVEYMERPGNKNFSIGYGCKVEYKYTVT